MLDLVPVRAGQSSSEALAASLRLVEQADALGYRRYWFAEHHNMPAVASTNPPVLIAAAAARSSRIRLGSGGVMLPNHAPLVVAEQFAALEALAPGRIDLGIGRAPGSDPIITQLLRRAGTTSEVDRFAENIRDILALSAPDGASLQLTSGSSYEVRATPAARTMPALWLLGSSDYSATLAASMGLPYVFAHHFSGEGTERALALYREQYRPSEEHPSPTTFTTVNVVADVSTDAAWARALPQLRMMARLRTGRPLIALETVEQAARAEAEDGLAAPFQRWAEHAWIVGTADEVHAGLAALAERFGVDEVMIVPVAASHDDEAIDRAPGRERTLALLAEKKLIRVPVRR